MRKIIGIALVALAPSLALAQSMNKDDGKDRAHTTGATGAMQNSTSNGVATDPGGVAAQQGDTAKSSAGTVGAAPGADTKSQNPSSSK